jgi:hypothetical protein
MAPDSVFARQTMHSNDQTKVNTGQASATFWLLKTIKCAWNSHAAARATRHCISLEASTIHMRGAGPKCAESVGVVASVTHVRS